ncbi:MAG: hypothetical protein KDB07_03920 [Planctomycetes bacterium]|nr:hypothetical protein [Planctomycetota bacterium]
MDVFRRWEFLGGAAPFGGQWPEGVSVQRVPSPEHAYKDELGLVYVPIGGDIRPGLISDETPEHYAPGVFVTEQLIECGEYVGVEAPLHIERENVREYV